MSTRGAPGGSCSQVRVLLVEVSERQAERIETGLGAQDDRLSVTTATLSELPPSFDDVDCLVCTSLRTYSTLADRLLSRDAPPVILFPDQTSASPADEAYDAGVTDYVANTGDDAYPVLAHRLLDVVSRHRESTPTDEQRRRRDAALRSLYEVTSDGTLAFGETIRRLLDVGRDRLGLGIGFLSAIDTETGSFHVVESRGDHELLQSGTTAPLSKTYCRRTLDSTEPLGVTHAVEEGWGSDEAYLTYELGCYLGVQVRVHGERYGTLCLASRTPREREFTETELTFVELLGTWVEGALERRHREEQLQALNEVSRELLETETHEEVCDVATAAAENLLDTSLAALSLYDDESGDLVRFDRPTEGNRSSPPDLVPDDTDSAEWRAFVENETVRYDRTGHPDDSPLAGGMAIPLGSHGVFVVGRTTAAGFDDTESNLAQMLAANTQAALEQAERREVLSRRETRLEEQNASLERVRRLNSVIRRIDQALVKATSREEIERTVCEELGHTDQYRLAWIGRYDSVSETVTPAEYAGEENGYLDCTGPDASQIELSDAEPRPAEGAAATHESHVVDDVLCEPPLSQWRQTALRCGFRSLVALPLVYADRLYGVLTICADTTDAFDDVERQVLEELGETIAYAIDAVENRAALVSDTIVELELSLSGTDTLPVTLTRRLDCTFRFTTAVSQSDGHSTVFFTVAGATPKAVVDFTEGSQSVRNLEVVAEREHETLYKATTTDDSLLSLLHRHGVVPTSLTADRGDGTLTVELAGKPDVRAFVDMFYGNYPAAELRSRRERERRAQTEQEYASEVIERLTDRQREVVQTAYVAGMYEWPRESTAEEVAELLGVSQPTVSRHVRASERTLLSLLFDP